MLSLLGHKVDRLKVPFLRRIDDSEEAREKTLVARWGRFVTRNARIIFPVLLVAGILARGSTSALVRLGAADQGTQPKSRPAGAPTTCSPRASGPASTARSRSSST